MPHETVVVISEKSRDYRGIDHGSGDEKDLLITYQDEVYPREILEIEHDYCCISKVYLAIDNKSKNLKRSWGDLATLRPDLEAVLGFNNEAKEKGLPLVFEARNDHLRAIGWLSVMVAVHGQ